MRTEVTSGQIVENRGIRALIVDRTVRTKILLIVVVLALVSVAVGALAINQMGTLNERLTAVRKQNIESLNNVSTLRSGMSTMYNASIAVATYVQGSPEAKAAQQAMFNTGKEQIAAGDATTDAAIADLRSSAADSATVQKRLDQLTEYLKTYRIFRAIVFYNEPPPAGFNLADVEPFKLEQQISSTINDVARAVSEDAEDAVAAGQDAYRQGVIWVISLLVIGLAVAVVLALVVAAAVTRSIRRVSAALGATARGDLTQTIEVMSRDELGEMAQALNQANDGISRTVRELTVQADTLASRSASLSEVSNQIAATAAGTKAEATVVSGTAARMSQNINTVSSGTSQMEASIHEIARNASESAKVAAEAVDVAQSTNDTMTKLGSSSAEIGSVIKTITAIAEQTNLLALNATIEAARAGDAGKGFAVVAGEVKDLAQETARATEDISRQISGIQSDTGAALTAIGQISSIISRINEYQVTIATAVEEQTATTNEIGRNVAEVATGITGMTGNISSIAESANSASQGVDTAKTSAEELNHLAEEMRRLTSQFRC